MSALTLDHPGSSTLDVASTFSRIYTEAKGDPARLPWPCSGASPSLIPWLNVEAPCLVRPGGRVIVIGCGLGHDAIELVNRGFDVTAIDCCPDAIEWAKTLHPDHADRFQVADVMNPPSRLLRRFDLAVEISAIDSVPPEAREEMARAMADLLGPHATLLSISQRRTEGDSGDGSGPCWPMTPDELIETFAAAGLAPVRDPDDYMDDGDPPMPRVRCAFRRVAQTCGGRRPAAQPAAAC
ncbi:MAG: class I SAM-dependent methyltransferase [Planctomycetota bacterium]|nr:class I SAM-dependent methyltransferase [Planctomycetota bacterium]